MIEMMAQSGTRILSFLTMYQTILSEAALLSLVGYYVQLFTEQKEKCVGES